MRVRCVLVILLMVTTPALAGEPAWRTANTANYRILSQLTDRESAAWMRDFDQYILSISDTMRIDLRTLPPLTVVIFARDKDYTPYKLQLPNGQTANVAGQFVRRPTWSMIAMASDSFDQQSRRTIFHEATHWLMSVDQSSQPPWFTEGIAELFSTFERRGDKVAWGQPINEHIALLRGGEEVPLAQFLIEPSALFDRDSHTSRFYAQAWAFTHYLMFSKDPTRRQSLISFLTTFKTQSGEATVKAVFGASLPDVEHDFHVYIDQRSWTYMIQPLKPAPDPPPMQPATPELIEASLGYLALGAGRQDLARQHAEKAVDLDPAAAEGHAILAYQALDASHYELAATHAEAALDRGSKDSQLFMLLGDSYLEGSNSNKPDAARTGATLYENAINLSLPRAAEYERLTEALFAVEKPRAEDAKFLQNGMHVFPGDDWLRVGSAVVEYRLGHADAALTTMDAALRPESKLDPQQRDYATNLRGGWLMTTMQSQVRDAVEKRDFAAARAVVSQYRERIGDAPQLQKFMQDTDDRLALNQVVAQFDSLMRDKKKAEARAVGEQLLARPNVPDAMRRYVQQRLGGGS